MCFFNRGLSCPACGAPRGMKIGNGWQGSEWIIGVAMQMAKGSAGVSPAPVGILPTGLKAGKKIRRHAIRQVAGGWPARCRPERAGCPRSPGTQLCDPCRNFRDRLTRICADFQVVKTRALKAFKERESVPLGASYAGEVAGYPYSVNVMPAHGQPGMP